MDDQVRPIDIAHETGQLGAALSDLVAGVYALATERETGKILKQRIREIEASASSVIRRAKRIADAR